MGVSGGLLSTHRKTDLDQERPAKCSFNRDVSWNQLDLPTYWQSNYQEPHRDDLSFIATIAAFMADHLQGRTDLRGVDVGTGANLYPAFSMLPFCSTVTLIDLSTSSIDWLTRELSGSLDAWTPFWDEYTKIPEYAAAGPLHEAIKAHARIEIKQASVFDLPGEQWDAGTMFFVAESISGDSSEFRAALARFVQALRPGAPFAVGFMENSEGWRVRDQDFPAVAVSIADVTASMPVSTELHQVKRLSAAEKPIRPGYTGMILACGIKRSTESPAR
ncbi:SCO2525 family SAM-dependent methyltransferase [Actinomadura bangladeshensis]|uniref:Methyltransferase n=1 Tax=Actinomadura bangladeshensis TaxID=453573 RepID=A0A4R4PAW3_9ACTN|nr:SCO2525 family SAM-dependent methyltransferase [Actinomadura bangladeshensis]TDC18220.1 methyltransferase [Actinomadura bangladeshensis]